MFLMLINFTPCGLCRSSLFLSFWLVQSESTRTENLSCDLEQSEGFPTSGNDTENKYSISDALRLCRRVLHKISPFPFTKEGTYSPFGKGGKKGDLSINYVDHNVPFSGQ